MAGANQGLFLFACETLELHFPARHYRQLWLVREQTGDAAIGLPGARRRTNPQAGADFCMDRDEMAIAEVCVKNGACDWLFGRPVSQIGGVASFIGH